MAERREILELWRRSPQTSGVLATVVRVEGSSYRRPGARLYIQPSNHAGSISGGCLEGEVIRKAQWMTRAGAVIQTYSTLFDNPSDEASFGPGASCAAVDSVEIPYGLGCGGVIDLLLEPAASAETDGMLRAMSAAENGEFFHSATVLPSPEHTGRRLARLILREDGSLFFKSENISAALQTQLATLACTATQSEFTSLQIDGRIASVFVEPIVPSQRLVLFGAGDDVRPLAHMAHLLGWRIAVADGRTWLAKQERFPEATQVVVLGEDANGIDHLQLTHRDAVALMTHSFEQDKNLLRSLLPLGLRYLGLLGARHRSRLLLTEVAQELGWAPEECLDRISAPIGLDLGGDGPEAVALAILAEIQSVLHNKDARLPVTSHDWFQNASERLYVPAHCPLDGPTNAIHTSDTNR